MKRLLLLLATVAYAYAQGPPSALGNYTVATRPTVGVGTQIYVTDGNSASDCITGTGSNKVVCVYNGSVWSSIGGGATLGANTFTGNQTLGSNALIGSKIYPTADSTTAIQINKSDGTTNVLNVDTTNGRVGIGTITPLTVLNVVDTVTTSPRGILSSQFSTGTDGARVGFSKARGTEGSPTVVVTGDTLGRLMFRGYDGSSFLEMGSVEIGVSGTVASTRVPTFMAFSTATNATPSVLTERMRIDNAGFVGIGTSTPTERLHVVGNQLLQGTLSIQNSSGAQQFLVNNTTSAVNYVAISGSTTGVGPQFTSTGSDTNIGLNFSTKGNSFINFIANSNTTMAILGVGPAGLRITGAADTGVGPTLSPQGVTNADLHLTSIGTGAVRVQDTTLSTGVTQLVCQDGAGQSTTACLQVKNVGGTAKFRVIGSGPFGENSVLTSALPACSTVTPVWRGSVSDATAPAIGVALTGGGAIFATVHCSNTSGTYVVDGL